MEVKKSKLYKMTMSNKTKEKHKREIYVTAESLVEATNKIVKALSISDELIDASLVSEECYV